MASKKAPRPIVEEPMLLVLHEKHGELHFHIPDEATLFEVSLDILKKRLNSGWWYYDPRGEEPIQPKVTREEAESLKEGALKNMAMEKVKEHEARVRRWKNAVADYDELKKAVEEKNGRLAWHKLRDCDGEYARVSLEHYVDEYPEQK